MSWSVVTAPWGLCRCQAVKGGVGAWEWAAAGRVPQVWKHRPKLKIQGGGKVKGGRNPAARAGIRQLGAGSPACGCKGWCWNPEQRAEARKQKLSLSQQTWKAPFLCVRWVSCFIQILKSYTNWKRLQGPPCYGVRQGGGFSICSKPTA